MDWSYYPNFTESEFACKHTGECKMQPAFMERLQTLRIAYGKPMQISSGYRSPSHPIEAIKTKPGVHSSGRACDVVVRGADALKLIELAIKHGFTGIGVNQKGASRFIHLDDLTNADSRPTIWSY
ncbi:D-Ala-D-Ala carboxypeptidase family metallohydrolase [Rheinheimera sp.]|uniref:YcbK family protein n=1 Tax=Rheinheimera sp. TaxID=1869214 RepID=UPI002732E153|nr:D-Ala-D-Ala carboxypeptidase family metallohydrolase [Rheinheimera sp.]MDP2715526.1 D-Ala-D-Ala carboxypeptidase family metallohydrolase [Rheinheimera sp.]